MTMRQFFTSALLALSAATLSAAPAPSVLDIKHSLRDDNVRPPESFETQSRVLEENFFLRNYTDSRQTSSDARLGTPEEYTRKLAQLNTEIEMPYNPVVGKLIDMYLGKRRNLVSNMLGLHDYYGDIFVEELEKEGMPLELQYLPVIESAINPNAVSRAGATGLWQFMPATAKGLGMEVSSLVDERRDARESSRNAARYLKQLYNIYGDWSLAIAAYNCGPGNVNKARRRAGDANSDFWEIYNYLPSETRGYVPAFIAANFVMNYHDDYGIHRPVIKRPLITDTVEVRERVHFNQIANVLNIPVDEIRMLNPQYRKDVIPGSPTRPYLLTLPSQQVLSYISSRDDILAYDADKYTPRSTVSIGPNKKKEEPVENPAQKEEKEENVEEAAKQTEPQQNTLLADQVTRTTHTVGRGEDLGSIAKHYGVSATDIKHWNNLRRGKVREGDQLVIELRQRNTVAAVNTRQKTTSQSSQTEVPARQTKARPATSANDYQNVPARSTSRSSASRASVPQRNSEKYKNKKQADAKKTTTKKARQQKPVEHTVKSGESLDKIAKRNGTTVDELRKANGMKKNATMLQPGQKLKIPKKTAEKAKSSKNKKDNKPAASKKTNKTASKAKQTSNKKKK
ncbi:MAG: transglycosylase SLT domain-containing protein [Paramuribaculum sp.]|nr:transglycosylase SLT domain-containing protein [Paramuribaculum sp.]